ncbi:hypothetical protein HYH03_000713 [Edaphochlamys debaryana]|uniref:Uncharacterized protein n=1 Tax=Edaphochlamys debaryana TaxID=47281 RepID=A0A836C7Y2_9CHLO|nr:hypothetical protein HYH03_000713 [Edaphochlamys debaryana]|eukprot:KAG2502227.1 hypothetical protein HYH03_000713 [Edaphochlamys debaryana]
MQSALHPPLRAELASARASWLRQAIKHPLRDSATNSRVHLYGTVHYGPYGGVEGLEELQELVAKVQPALLAIEQPFDLAAQAGMPQPELLSELLTVLERPDAAVLAGSDGTHESDGRQDSAASTGTSSQGPAAQLPEAVEREAARLRALLPGLAVPARVGRDMLDPYEVLGMYGSVDYVTRPSQLAEALALFGFLPGLELAALVLAAQDAGVQVFSVDAPLRLQEKWVASLVADFRLSEADLPRRLQHDLAAAAAMLPASYPAWDMAVADAVRRREAAAAEAAGPAGPRQAPSEPSTETVTAFKVSRAVAAASLPYDSVREAYALQASLQPLKWGLFARRARHLVLQARDLCQRMSVRRVRVDADQLADGTGAGPEGAAEGEAGLGPGLVDDEVLPEQVVLMVVGRQYVPYIEELWANPKSALWHGDVPRSFAPSKLDRLGIGKQGAEQAERS